MNQPVLFIYRKMKEDDKVSRAKNPKYESMSPEELKANMEKSRQELVPLSALLPQSTNCCLASALVLETD